MVHPAFAWVESLYDIRFGDQVRAVSKMVCKKTLTTEDAEDTEEKQE
jgi:hypothetical protein